MQLLSKFDSKKTAIVNKIDFPEFAKKITSVNDTLASIRLVNYKSNDLVYESKTNSERIAVFSETYYKNGWNAYINGKLTPHFRANYVLRALKIPAGNNKIEFKFEPQVVKTGSIIALISFLIMMVLLIGGIYFEVKSGKVKS